MSLVLRYVGDSDAAKDVLQDSFISIFTTISRFKWRGSGSLAAWMQRIAVNGALNYLRDNRHMDNDADEIPDVEEEAPDAGLVEKIDTDTLLRFISELPQGYRMVFNMFCIEGYSHREIARELGINERSSASQLVRAKGLLAKKIKTYIKENEL